MKSILAIVAICMLAVGCVQPPPQPPAVQVDPFNIQIQPPAVPVCPPGYCPDGQCPIGPQNAIGTEVTSELSMGDSIGVNTLAATEVKEADGPTVGICLPCQPRAPFATVKPTQVFPSASTQPAGPTSSASIGEPVKHGAYRCEMCKKATVGEAWEDLWTDDGISLMCVCKDCFAKAKPDQREAAITNFLKRGDPELLKRASVQQAIKTVSSD
jgi:hypothetical protein